jgi:hypothetical protein
MVGGKTACQLELLGYRICVAAKIQRGRFAFLTLSEHLVFRLHTRGTVCKYIYRSAKNRTIGRSPMEDRFIVW